MKYLVFLFCLLLFSCKSDTEAIDPGAKSYGLASTNNVFFSKWKLVNYENESSIKYDISLEFKPETTTEGIYKLNGKSAVNFYFADFKFDNATSTMKISNFSVTEIAGKAEDQKFEDDYLDRLANVVRYDLTNGILTLFLPDKTKKKLIFKLSQ